MGGQVNAITQSEYRVALSYRFSSELTLSEVEVANNLAASTTLSRWSLPPAFSI